MEDTRNIKFDTQGNRIFVTMRSDVFIIDYLSVIQLTVNPSGISEYRLAHPSYNIALQKKLTRQLLKS